MSGESYTLPLYRTESPLRSASLVADIEDIETKTSLCASEQLPIRQKRNFTVNNKGKGKAFSDDVEALRSSILPPPPTVVPPTPPPNFKNISISGVPSRGESSRKALNLHSTVNQAIDGHVAKAANGTHIRSNTQFAHCSQYLHLTIPPYKPQSSCTDARSNVNVEKEVPCPRNSTSPNADACDTSKANDTIPGDTGIQALDIECYEMPPLRTDDDYFFGIQRSELKIRNVSASFTTTPVEIGVGSIFMLENEMKQRSIENFTFRGESVRITSYVVKENNERSDYRTIMVPRNLIVYSWSKLGLTGFLKVCYFAIIYHILKVFQFNFSNNPAV